jgi:hypothetical protein
MPTNEAKVDHPGGSQPRHHLVVENGVVVNVVWSTDDFAESQGWVPCPVVPGIGWTTDDHETFTPPATGDA